MLNGWQRLWILVCVLWGALVVSVFYVLLYTEGELGLADNVSWSDTAFRVFLMLVIWAVPCLAIYALGAGLARWRRSSKGKP